LASSNLTKRGRGDSLPAAQCRGVKFASVSLALTFGAGGPHDRLAHLAVLLSPTLLFVACHDDCDIQPTRSGILPPVSYGGPTPMSFLRPWM
jgi:hypothetical protein